MLVDVLVNVIGPKYKLMLKIVDNYFFLVSHAIIAKVLKCEDRLCATMHPETF